jgi:hypothetical protein
MLSQNQREAVRKPIVQRKNRETKLTNVREVPAIEGFQYKIARFLDD